MPAPAVVIAEIFGLCEVELKLLGPVQTQLVAPVAAPVKESVLPAQIGFGLAAAVTAVGMVFTTTEAVLTAVAGPQELLAVKE